MDTEIRAFNNFPIEGVRMKLPLFLIVLGMISISFGSAYAEEAQSFFVAAGVAKPEDIDATFYVTGGYRWEFSRGWAIEPNVGYWKADNVERQCPGPTCSEYDLKDLHVGLHFLRVAPMGSADVFVGGGAAAHFRERTASTSRGVEHTSTRLGIHFRGGVEFPLASAISLTTGIGGDFVFRDVPFEDQFVLKAQAGLRFFFD